MPDAVALVCEGRTLTYGELDRRANQLAHALARRGVGPEIVVGVCLDRSIELVVALYAVLKAGGAYAPLDPEYPRERLAFMLDDLAAPVIVTDARLAGVLPEGPAALLRLDADADAIAREPDGAPVSGAALRRPRLRHLHLRLDRAAQGRRGRTREPAATWSRGTDAPSRSAADDRCTQIASPGFDAAVWEIWPALAAGRLAPRRPRGAAARPGRAARLAGAREASPSRFLPTAVAEGLIGLGWPPATARCATC